MNNETNFVEVFGHKVSLCKGIVPNGKVKLRNINNELVGVNIKNEAGDEAEYPIYCLRDYKITADKFINEFNRLTDEG